MTDKEGDRGLAGAHVLIVCLLLAVGSWALGPIEALATIGGCFALFTIVLLLDSIGRRRAFDAERADLVWWYSWLFVAILIGLMAIRKVIVVLSGKTSF